MLPQGTVVNSAAAWEAAAMAAMMASLSSVTLSPLAP